MNKPMLLLTAALLGGCQTASMGVGDDIPTVNAFAETDAVASREDAADDPAIWINPLTPSESVILGTDKKNGLYVYDLSGRELQFIDVPEPNNVDLRQGVAVGDGVMDIAVTSNRGDNTVGVFMVDGGTVGAMGSFPAIRPEPYGICLGTPDGALMVAVTHKNGAVDLFSLDTLGQVAGTHLQTLNLGAQLEGCVFDEVNERLFVGIEEQGIVAYTFADLTMANATPVFVDRVNEASGLAIDVEGLTIYPSDDQGGGYLIASSQGNNSYALYDRQTLAFISRFAIVDGETIDGTQETDGIDVTAANLGPDLPLGILVVQDGENPPVGRQNFKIVDWQDIAKAVGLP